MLLKFYRCVKVVSVVVGRVWRRELSQKFSNILAGHSE